MNDKQELFHTTNIKAATALLTMGFKKVAISKICRDDGKDSVVFWFDGRNDDGLQASTVFHGMTKGSDELAKKEPENIINYLRCYAHNRDELIRDVHKTPRMVVIEKDGRKLAISENASEETRRKISAMF